MPDGAVLRADAWAPAVGKWPVLLQRLPYGRSVASTPVLPHPEQLARHGYAVVIQDVRGRGDSEGRFDPFVDDGTDGAASIEWAARLPFSDGRVATYGFSYQGLNQLAAAARRPPSLRAIAPLMCAPEPYEGWTYEGGALRWPFVAGWAAQLAAQEPGAAPVSPALDALPTADALGSEPPRWFSEWLTHPKDDAYWAERRADLSLIDVPVFTVLGFFDDFAAGTAKLFALLDAEGVCGPWAHMPWGTRLGDIELGEAASPAVAHAALLAFFDRVLKSARSAGTAVQYYDRAAGWLHSPTWPPAHNELGWSASSDGRANSRHGEGRLEPGVEMEPLEDVLVSEPLVPYPGTLAPLSDESAAEDRRDVLCYTTAAVLEPLAIAGTVRARARIEADVDTHDLVVSVVVVDRAGRPRRLTTSIRRLTVSPAVPQDVMLELGPFAWTVAAGERLRVDVTASRFPAFDRNPQSGARPAALTGRDGCVVGTIHLLGLHVILPVTTEPWDGPSPARHDRLRATNR